MDRATVRRGGIVAVVVLLLVVVGVGYVGGAGVAESKSVMGLGTADTLGRLTFIVVARIIGPVLIAA